MHTQSRSDHVNGFMEPNLERQKLIENIPSLYPLYSSFNMYSYIGYAHCFKPLVFSKLDQSWELKRLTWLYSSECSPQRLPGKKRIQTSNENDYSLLLCAYISLLLVDGKEFLSLKL